MDALTASAVDYFGNRKWLGFQLLAALVFCSQEDFSVSSFFPCQSATYFAKSNGLAGLETVCSVLGGDGLGSK